MLLKLHVFFKRSLLSSPKPPFAGSLVSSAAPKQFKVIRICQNAKFVAISREKVSGDRRKQLYKMLSWDAACWFLIFCKMSCTFTIKSLVSLVI